MEVLQRVKLARQSHYLAVRRAGEWPRGRAEQLRSEYVRRAWRVLLAEGAVLLAFTPLALLAPTWLRDFIVGGWAVFVGWLLWHQVVVESGSSTRDMGALAEQWTSNDLKLLRRRGWRVINHIVLRHWDIDHVAIGPGGLLVVQTKWSSDEAALRDLTSVTAGLRADAEDVRLMLKARLGQLRPALSSSSGGRRHAVTTPCRLRQSQGCTLLPAGTWQVSSKALTTTAWTLRPSTVPGRPWPSTWSVATPGT